MTLKHLVPFLSLFLFLGTEAHGFGKRPIADALDSQVQSLYPGQSCEQLTAFARERGARTLIIGFEGLASFDSTGTHSSYRQHLQAVSGQGVEALRRGSGGYLLHGLLNRVMRENARHVEVLVLPYTASAETCAETWMREPGNRLVLTGHSFGGHTAAQLAAQLERRNVPVAAVLTVDPRLKGYVGSLQRTANVARWENYYQKNTPFLNGYLVPGADVNSNLSSTGVKHVTVPYSPAVRAALERTLAQP